jgi:hypothetical protein
MLGMAAAGHGLACFWVKLAATGFGKSGSGLHKHFYSNTPYCQGKQKDGEKNDLHNSLGLLYKLNKW